MSPMDRIRDLIGSGTAVMGLDLFMQGEFIDSGETSSVQNSEITYSRKNDVPADSWQRSPVYYYGYNDSIFVRRVHDVLSAIRMIKTHPKWEVKKVTVYGTDGAAHWAVAAGAMAPESDRRVTYRQKELPLRQTAKPLARGFCPRSSEIWRSRGADRHEPRNSCCSGEIRVVRENEKTNGVGRACLRWILFRST